MIRKWETELRVVGGEGHNAFEFTQHDTHSPKETRNIIRRTRIREKEAGLPHRPLGLVALWILEDLICKYFEEYVPKGAVLEQITIKDIISDDILQRGKTS